MRKKYPNLIRVLVVLTMVVSLVGMMVAPASAQTIDLSVTEGSVGTSVTITASGFLASAVLSAKFDGAGVDTIPKAKKADSSGEAVLGVKIPAGKAGVHVLQISDGLNSVSATFTITPAVKISKSIGPVGTEVTVTGSGFTPGVSVTANVGSGAVVSSTDYVPIEIDGSFTATGKIPDITAGLYDLTAKDGAGNEALKANAFTVTPLLELVPGTGNPGIMVTVKGSGWPAGTVNLFILGTAWVDVTANAAGKIDERVQITGVTSPGIVQVAGYAAAGPESASTTYTITPRVLSITPLKGPSGTKVLITGTTFTPDSAIPIGALWFGIFNTWNTGVSPQPGEIAIDSGGVMAATTAYIPDGSTVGDATVVAVDPGKNGVLDFGADDIFAYMTFEVTKPTVAVNPDNGVKGTAVTITGSGWVPNSTVTLNFSGTPMSVFADGVGDIAAAMSVPGAALSGMDPAAISAADTRGNEAAAVSFTVPAPEIDVAPMDGAPGIEFTVTGIGFRGYAPITVSFGGYNFPTQVLASPVGEFTFTANIPGLAPGNVIVRATDGSSTSTKFFVISKAPTTVGSALATITNEVVRVWEYYNDAWKFWDPADPVGSDLTGLTAGRGYWIKVSAAVQLISGGYSYDLSEGWNNPGWR